MTYVTENGIRWTRKPTGLTPPQRHLKNVRKPRSLDEAKRDKAKPQEGKDADLHTS